MVQCRQNFKAEVKEVSETAKYGLYPTRFWTPSREFCGARESFSVGNDEQDDDEEEYESVRCFRESFI